MIASRPLSPSLIVESPLHHVQTISSSASAVAMVRTGQFDRDVRELSWR
jgi:hypothetical protein